MKRTAILALVTALFLSACIPTLPSIELPGQAPAVDVQATDQALAATLAVETLNALPTPTLEPATNTPEPTASNTESATATETPTATTDPDATATETSTPDPNASATATGTPVTATATITGTLPTATVTVTGTLPTVTQSATPTATETLYARFYGTLPPSIPYGKVKLVNKAKTEVYISMHCATVDGYTTIIEYPVDKRLRVDAPAGTYSYVAWVGGRQYLGGFKLGQGSEIEITFDKNKVSTK